ncbi:RHS repeat domain-containing protein [Chitinophaga dinghuensis]|uniref:RHS repeat domain-containing protein n=1 Tax=Chitinophaga dinghuensis TaxID=1539050 RepID=UPI0011B93489|nr:RHS repeat-associated core domain-containing protein [Chitinophaga dinghuensis]
MKRSLIPQKLSFRLLTLLALLTGLTVQAQHPVTFSRVLDGSNNELVANASILVKDEAFYSAADPSRLILPYKIDNLVTLKVNEYSTRYIPDAFTATAKVLITYTYLDATNHEQTDTTYKTLIVNNDTAKNHLVRSSFLFHNSRQVNVTLVSLTTSIPAATATLVLENEMTVLPVYSMDPSRDVVQGLRQTTATSDDLEIGWNPVTGADEYDLEWTFIDSSRASRYATDPSQNFRNNATRVTLQGTDYKIPLLYEDTGVVFFRVRAVQVKSRDARIPMNWSNVASFTFLGHEKTLNWQSSISFAEDGKNKAVVSYFDGNMLNRQVVTKDNVLNRTIVGESLYDNLGRAVISVLPVPTIDSVIKYNALFNRDTLGNEYDKSNYDYLDTLDNYFAAAANPMSVMSGASRYYSPNSPDTSGFNKLIPDANQYPFTETVYVSDNTNRVSRQSGLGSQFRLGRGFETVYSYGGATQNDLDAMFGTDAGNAQHYFRNTVRDANGVYSVFYLDMHGRTVATALSGSPMFTSLSDLPDKSDVTDIITLSGKGQNTIADNSMSISHSFTAEQSSQYTFTYNLSPPVYKKTICGQETCYAGLYELEIKISDDYNNMLLPDRQPIIKTYRNFLVDSILPNCTPPPFQTISFSLDLGQGSYNVVKTLKISKDAMDYYRDSVYSKQFGACVTIDQFVQQQRSLVNIGDCAPSCSSCIATLGSYPAFRDSYLARIGIPLADSTQYVGEITAAYQKAADNCAALCTTSTESMETRTAMLLDMTAPSGQYATLLDSASKYSIFYMKTDTSTPLYQRDDLVYLDEKGNPDKVFSTATGTYVRPQQLNMKEFAGRFKNSWAATLLPFHPEYCKLVEQEKHNGSLAWDIAYRNEEDYTKALAAGYFVPTTIDPLAAESAAIKADLNSKISNYQGHTSLWSIAAANVLCSTADQNCVNSYAIIGGIDTSLVCKGDRNMIWQTYRDLYLQIKKDYIDSLISRAGCIPTDSLLANGKYVNFQDVKSVLKQTNTGYLLSGNFSTGQVAQDSANAIESRTYLENCKSFISKWIEQLSPCTYYSPVQVDTIIARLLTVCIAGADRDHPYGSSTINPGRSNAYASFEDVINRFNSDNGIATTPYCNGSLISTHFPYNMQPDYGDKPIITKPSDCECSNITALNTEYKTLRNNGENFSDFLLRAHGINMSADVLTKLLSACNMTSCTYLEKVIYIPSVLQCNRRSIDSTCATCDMVNLCYGTFTSTYPGMTPQLKDSTPLQTQINLVFQNFMNSRLGLSKQAWEYIQFHNRCVGAPSDNMECYSQQSLAMLNGKESGYTSYPGTMYYSKQVINHISATKDGGSISAGIKYDTGTGELYNMGYVVKMNDVNRVEWAKAISLGNGVVSLKKIRQTSDGGYIAIGTSSLNSGNPGFLREALSIGLASYDSAATIGVFIIKLDASGNLQWSKTLHTGAQYGDYGRDIIQLASGKYAIAASHDVHNGQGAWEYGVLNSNGSLAWAKITSFTSSDILYTLAEDGDSLVLGGLGFTSSLYKTILAKVSQVDGSMGISSWVRSARKNDIQNLYATPTGYKVVLSDEQDNNNNDEKTLLIDLNKYFNLNQTVLIDRPPASSNLNGNVSARMADGSILLATQVNTSETSNHYLYKIKADNSFDWVGSLSSPGGQNYYTGIATYGSKIFASGMFLGSPAIVTFGSDMVNCFFTNTTATASAPTYSVVTAAPTTNSTISPSSWYDQYVFLSDSIPSVLMSNCGYSICKAFENSLTLCPTSTTTSLTDINQLTLNNCSDSSFFITTNAMARYNAYLDSLNKEFDSEYIATCRLADSLEQFKLARTISEYHYTLYYYDQAGNLIRTVPPAGAVVDRSETWLSQVRAARATGSRKVPNHQLSTIYRYNSLNQVVGQTSPDGGTSLFWYDRLGRLAVSQNQRQAGTMPASYSYTLYDNIGRITEVGELSSGTAITSAISRTPGSLATWLSNASATKREITRTVYDQANDNITPALAARNLRNRVAYSAVYNNAADTVAAGYASATYYSYDILGNVDTLLQDYKLGLMADSQKNRFKRIVYDYDLVSGKVNQVSYQPGAKDAFYHKYSYDASNRLTDVETSRDSIYWEKEAYYQYYAHGPLARVEMGQQKVQGIDYAYTLQGWMKGVNSTAGTAAADIGHDGASGSQVARDAFGYALHYYGDDDYKPVSNGVKPFALSVNPAFNSLFNGNIAAMSVQLPSVGQAQMYAYGYDALNRLISMDTYRGLNTITNTWTPTAADDYKEKVAYDPNGNILQYLRNGSAASGLAMDSLNYHYIAGSNKLDFVSDAVSASAYNTDIDNQLAHNYSYDQIGNLTADHAGGIDSIKWNLYGKISSIQRTGQPLIEYTYDVSGNRISKRVGGVQTWYVRDATGNVMSIYTIGDSKVNNGSPTLTETHLYGVSRIGMMMDTIKMDTIVTSPFIKAGITNGIFPIFIRGNKFFELSNHLGNVMAVVSDRRRSISTDGTSIDHYEPVVTSAHDYYPFGALMPGRGGNWEDSVPNRYGFNGKENDNEVKGEGNQQDYGMRIYDPRLGRFLSVDPLTQMYPFYTPYQFASNTPVLSIDIDGLEGNVNVNSSEIAVDPRPTPSTPPQAQNAIRTRVDFKSNMIRGYNPIEKIGQLPPLPPLSRLVALTGLLTIIPNDFFQNTNRHPENSYLNNRDADAQELTEDLYEKNNPEKNIRYVTYTKTKINLNGTMTVYSGRSSGPANLTAFQIIQLRDKQHTASNTWLKGYGPAVLDQQAVGNLKNPAAKWAIRGREQQLIDFNGGALSDDGTSGNRIRGVGKLNPRGVIYHYTSNILFHEELHAFTGFNLLRYK